MKRRLFLGIDFPAKVKRQLFQLTKGLAEDYPGVRWVKQRNFHITLKFLGHTDIHPDEILSVLRLQIRKLSPFTLSFGGLEVFRKHTTIFYIQINKSAPLNQLYLAVDREMKKLGFSKKKKSFVAHVTLGRSKKPHRLRTSNLEKFTKPNEALVNKLTLFQSKLTSSGAIYERLAEMRFFAQKLKQSV